MVPIPTHKTFKNLIGHPPFTRLTVVSFAGYVQKTARPFPTWNCRCSCGNSTVVDTQSLLKNHTRSCGCLQVEHTVHMGHKNTTHGNRFTPEYNVWYKMNRRCNDPRMKEYKTYGGRGITVCERWKDFAAFLEDMGSRPTPKHSIDRIDNNLGYCKDNCRWTTQLQQARNKQNTIFLTYRGETRCITEWAEVLNISKYVLCCRYHSGWDHERLLSTPVRKLTRHVRNS